MYPQEELCLASRQREIDQAIKDERIGRQAVLDYGLQSLTDEVDMTGLEDWDRWRLLLGLAIKRRLDVDPSAVVDTGIQNLNRILARSPQSASDRSHLQRWATLLKSGPDAVAHVLASRSRDARGLRFHMPFGGVLTNEEHLAINYLAWTLRFDEMSDSWAKE